MKVQSLKLGLLPPRENWTAIPFRISGLKFYVFGRVLSILRDGGSVRKRQNLDSTDHSNCREPDTTQQNRPRTISVPTMITH
jgi:hypothetical protein